MFLDTVDRMADTAAVKSAFLNPTSAVREKIPRKIKVIRCAKSFRHHSFAGVVLNVETENS
jgi:hypothetical protein